MGRNNLDSGDKKTVKKPSGNESGPGDSDDENRVNIISRRKRKTHGSAKRRDKRSSSEDCEVPTDGAAASVPENKGSARATPEKKVAVSLKNLKNSQQKQPKKKVEEEVEVDEEEEEESVASKGTNGDISNEEEDAETVEKEEKTAEEPEKVVETTPLVLKRGRGRPKSHKKNLVIVKPTGVKRGRGRPPKYRTPEEQEEHLKMMKAKAIAAEHDDDDDDDDDDVDAASVNGDKRARNLPFRKSKRKHLPLINLEDFEDDSDEEPVRKKRVLKNKRFPPGLTKSWNTQSSKKQRETDQQLTAHIDRLASLVVRLENRINLDGLVDEDTDIEADLEDDVQILLLQRNYNVMSDLKRSFKDMVKEYIEKLGAENGCLIASIRSYKNSGIFTVYEIWSSESDHKKFLKSSTNEIFSDETEDMMMCSTVVNTMTIPASWWHRRT